MKKLIVAVLAAALMSFGLVATTSTSAFACADAYTGPCVPVEKPEVPNKKVNKGGKVKVKVDIQPKSGDADVYGAVTLTCTNGKATKSRTKAYGGPTKVGLFNFRKKGVWDCTLKFYGANAKNVTEKFKVRVR